VGKETFPLERSFEHLAFALANSLVSRRSNHRWITLGAGQAFGLWIAVIHAAYDFAWFPGFSCRAKTA
jgi:hypothetical protein